MNFQTAFQKVDQHLRQIGRTDLAEAVSASMLYLPVFVFVGQPPRGRVHHLWRLRFGGGSLSMPFVVRMAAILSQNSAGVHGWIYYDDPIHTQRRFWISPKNDLRSEPLGPDGKPEF